MAFHTHGFTWAVGLLFATMPALAQLPVKIEKELENAKNKYNIDWEAANTELIESFDTVVTSIRKSPKLKGEALIQAIAVINEEKLRFEKSGLIPLSQSMRAHCITYLRKIRSADAGLSKAYEKSINFLTKSNNDDDAKALISERDNLLAPKLVAVIKRLDLGFEWPLRSNGTGDGSRTWALTTNALVVEYHDPATPNKLTYTCVVQANGIDFECVGTGGGKFRAKLVIK